MSTSSQFTLLRNANVFAPAALGLKNILICGKKILYIGEDLPQLSDCLTVQEIDLTGKAVLPGFIDAHTHITGGGGEAGFATRVPPVPLSHFTSAGVTSVVGLLGTDDVTRNTQSVVAQVYALREEGLSAWCYTGGYHLPPTTLTGSVKSDIVFIEPVIAVGELAISDHRSSQPTFDELIKVAAECHVARLMTGKAGVLHLHLGDGERGLSLVRRALQETEIPARTFNPTHVNRRRALFEEACELTQKGCWIDITAFETGPDGYEPDEAILHFLEQGFPTDKLTISSDGGGCLPCFNQQGELTKMDFATSKAMTAIFFQLLQQGQSIDKILPFFSQNVANLLQLPNKGQLTVNGDADLIVLNTKQDDIDHVMALGRWHKFNGEQIKKGTFEV
ncbi:beta-aspartyl-peptidase [Planctobacterium marinum]|uniref:Isoaspartyl dipeptidase n=1 Tax=Planctobacterium marinum TaxID=1631968 RepID=A0AA48HK56_9ALTE|nr:isoaspartyl dipeptidase [Planctobacterium marinum]